MAEKNLTLIKYKLDKFNSTKAASGSLCAVVKTADFGDSSYASVPNVDTATKKPKEGFIGTGVCMMTDSNHYTIIVDSISYQVDSNGNGVYITSENNTQIKTPIKFMLATILDAVSYAGNVVDSSTTPSASRTRSSGGTSYEDTGITYADVVKSVETLYPRDQFALQALRGLLSHIKNPHTLSDSEMNFYCNAAYQWAANMMSAAANARGTIDDKTETATTRAVDVGELDNNTDKLLNNLIAELERNDEASNSGTWSKTGETSKKGAYTDAAAKTLGNYADIEAAEKDGWTWTADTYAERITFKDVTMSGIENLINQLRGAYGNNQFYNMSLFEHDLEEWLIAYTKKLGSSETRNTVGLQELINTIANIKFDTSGIDTKSIADAITNKSTSRVVSSMPSLSGTMQFGNSGLGRDADHPIYIEGGGGGFPSRQVLATAFAADIIHDFLTFNADGAVGYSTKEETKKAILGYLNSYADIDALSTAVYNSLKTTIDNRIKAWLEAAKDAEGRSLTVNTPT